MFNEEVLSEKLKYLITMGCKQSQFEVMNLNVEFEFIDQNHEKLHNYDVDIKFDYNGPLEFLMSDFTHDIAKMSEKLGDIISEFVISQNGKIVKNDGTNCYISEPMIYSMEYRIDEKHIFELGYRFHYND